MKPGQKQPTHAGLNNNRRVNVFMNTNIAQLRQKRNNYAYLPINRANTHQIITTHSIACFLAESGVL
jgi:hypothetical protein